MFRNTMTRKIFLTLRRFIIAGLIISLPLVVTIFSLNFVFNFLNSFITPLIIQALELLQLPYLDTALFFYLIPIIGLFLTLFTIALLGLLGTNFIGRALIGSFERMILAIPIIKSIYGGAKQLLDAFSSASRGAFEELVLIEYPKADSYVIGFITADSTIPTDSSLSNQDLVNVFIPTTPNPTSGFLLIVPREKTIKLKMSIDAGIKYIVSGGLLAPSLASPELKAAELEAMPEKKEQPFSSP